ncbi:MAG: acyloxyacyl hydrolase [Sphingomonadaceae bacterium]|nr:acyloxyacyl hydrolase [Sphingomonadaceae bacterium]
MRRLVPVLPLLLATAPAEAQEVFGGVLAHDVHLPIDKGGFENGIEVELGWRGPRLHGLSFLGSPRPYVLASVVPSGGTHFAAAGLGWELGAGPAYFRPAAGLAVNTQRLNVFNEDGRRLDLGSRVTFEPELAIGYRIGGRAAIEGVLVHLSHAGLFNSRQNPGMDSVGLRFAYRFR